MKNNMKKILCVLLAVITAVVCIVTAVSAVAATNADSLHVIRGANVSNATSYELYEKSGTTYTLKKTGTSINFDLDELSLSIGDHTFVVKATANGFADSDYSNALTYTKKGTLATPSLTNKSTAGVCQFTFPSVANATGYEVYVNGTKVTTYTLSESSGTVTVVMNTSSFSAAGNYSITVKAVSTSNYYIDSAVSSAITFTKQKLATPSITLQ